MNKLAVAFGFLMVAVSTWQLGSLNLNMAISNFVWPTVF